MTSLIHFHKIISCLEILENNCTSMVVDNYVSHMSSCRID